MVLAAAGSSPSRADEALTVLFRNYWYPLYEFLRRSGHGHHDAEDLTQAYFGMILEKGYLADADRNRGRFRTFLLATLKNFVANDWKRRKRKKRGGGFRFVPFDESAARAV